jgi:hypothetical protein
VTGGGGGPTWNLRSAMSFGVDGIVALEYRVGDWLHGIEFMTLDASGLVSFAAGNDVLPPEQPR